MSDAARVIVTRAQPEASRWVSDLRARGIAALALPLLEIADPLDWTPVDAAARQLAQYAAVMFVSGNAARFFCGRMAALGLDVGARCDPFPRAWTPGPGTARALLRLGWPASRIDQPPADAPRFDSESLWSVVQAQVGAGRRVLFVRGADARGAGSGRDWLADRVQQTGAQITQVQTYRRMLPHCTPATRALAAQALGDGSIWLLSSAEAVANLRQWLGAATPLAPARALATHPRIALAARQAGFGQVGQCAPQLDAVERSIKSAP
ncbi:MAG: uroporphyrinogen-III synthase [Burkholderiaceae bacterium]|jgi:uroporphyrinogen-III synthase|nr:uroporphyrinogen-III synthase [Burkholderiaceae bacterium]